ncbi:hypothetical protein Hanom_Chr06g00540691 [Helianthus anomalus]
MLGGGPSMFGGPRLFCMFSRLRSKFLGLSLLRGIFVSVVKLDISTWGRKSPDLKISIKPGGQNVYTQKFLYENYTLSTIERKVRWVGHPSRPLKASPMIPIISSRICSINGVICSNTHTHCSIDKHICSIVIQIRSIMFEKLRPVAIKRQICSNTDRLNRAYHMRFMESHLQQYVSFTTSSTWHIMRGLHSIEKII